MSSMVLPACGHQALHCRVNRGGGTRAVEDARTAAMADVDDAPRLQKLKRFAHGGAADTEGHHHVALGRQGRAGGVFARFDRGHHLVGDAMQQFAAGNRTKHESK